MGITTYLVPQPDRLTASTVRQCYMQGVEAIPWRSQNRLDGDQHTIQRATSESGQLFVPWPVPGRGRITLSTACLQETDTPYQLPVELARGTVGRLRNQIEMWGPAGMEMPAEVVQRVSLATRALGRAATSQDRPATAAQAADEAIIESLDSIDLLMNAYSQYALAGGGKRTVFFGANLGTQPGRQIPHELLDTINTAIVPFSWCDVEGSAGHNSLDLFADQVRWGRELGLRICGGPLLEFDQNRLPDWLYLWEEDADSLQSYMTRYVQSIAKKFTGQVNLWHAWAGLNCGRAMSLTEEFRLRIGVAAVEALRQVDATTPVFVSFDQPWGEYLARQSLDLAPIHYADTLVRADLGVSGFGLEINLGYRPHGTLPRDLLELSRLIDRWSTLGLPLVMIFAIPSADITPSNEQETEIMPTGCDELNVNNQARIASEMIRTCLSKPAVQGVIWNQLFDGDSANYPNAGLYTSDATAKPILASLHAIRHTYLT